jgi:glycosyltransferase involved in cell wall biosynthesis
MALFPLAWLAKVQTLRALDLEIAVSKYDLQRLRYWYPSERARFRQIYHSKIHPPLKGDETVNEEREHVILCVGTFGPRKGQRVLADAFADIAAQYPGWKLVFAGRVGDSGDWEAIQKLYSHRQLLDRITLLQDLSHEAIEHLYRKAAIFVMPSLFEGLGLSLQEALYHGCACIATRCGGPEDLIDDGNNGFLVRKSDPVALGAALGRLLSDPDLRVRLGQLGKQSILKRNMTAPDMVNSYRKLYAEVQ